MRIVSCQHTDAPICADCLLTNLKIDRITTAEALARIALASPVIDRHRGVLGDEGWGFFNLPDLSDDAHDYLEAGVERFDEEEIFTDDDAALKFVAERAAAGSMPHLAAMIIEGACNSIRAAIWGEEWVDSRMGPDLDQLFGSRNDQPTLIMGKTSS